MNSQANRVTKSFPIGSKGRRLLNYGAMAKRKFPCGKDVFFDSAGPTNLSTPLLQVADRTFRQMTTISKH